MIPLELQFHTSDSIKMPESSERPTVNTILRASTLLNALTEDEIQSLTRVCRMAHAERGELIWWNGSEVDYFGIAGTGFVKMVQSDSNGADTTIELMGPGQIFGMMGTITGRGCPLRAEAMTSLWYVRIPKQQFLPIYEKSGNLKDRLIRKTSIRFQDMVNLFTRMASGKVDQRVAAILMILAESYGERVGRRIRLGVPLTRQEIGEMAGTTTETTIRVLSRWQKDGLIATDSHHIVILNEDELARILGKLI